MVDKAGDPRERHGGESVDELGFASGSFGRVGLKVGGERADALCIPELVVRTTTWIFNAGTEVYELTDPDGNTYVMQSYALYEDPDLTADDPSFLPDLSG